MFCAWENILQGQIQIYVIISPLTLFHITQNEKFWSHAQQKWMVPGQAQKMTKTYHISRVIHFENKLNTKIVWLINYYLKKNLKWFRFTIPSTIMWLFIFLYYYFNFVKYPGTLKASFFDNSWFIYLLVHKCMLQVTQTTTYSLYLNSSKVHMIALCRKQVINH